MTSTSTISISDAIGKLAERINQDELRPLGIAPVSPFHEVLIRDVCATLPAALRTHVESATSLEQVNEWIAAAAMYRWIEDSHWQRRFLQLLEGDPRRASLALVEAMSEPPPPTRAWHRADVSGALLLIVVAAGLLAARAAVVGLLARAWLDTPAPVEAVAWWFGALCDLPLLTTATGDMWATVALCLMAAWHAAELRLAPRLFERVRRAPARWWRVAAPCAGRRDAFTVAWSVHTSLLWALLVVRMAGPLRDAIVGDQVTIGTKLVALVLGGLVLWMTPVVVSFLGVLGAAKEQ